MSSSGLVLPPASTVRAAHETGNSPPTPLARRATPLPSPRPPFQVAAALLFMSCSFSRNRLMHPIAGRVVFRAVDHVVIRKLEHLTGSSSAPAVSFAVETRDRPGPALADCDDDCEGLKGGPRRPSPPCRP